DFITVAWRSTLETRGDRRRNWAARQSCRCGAAWLRRHPLRGWIRLLFHESALSLLSRRFHALSYMAVAGRYRWAALGVGLIGCRCSAACGSCRYFIDLRISRTIGVPPCRTDSRLLCSFATRIVKSRVSRQPGDCQSRPISRLVAAVSGHWPFFLARRLCD